MTRLSPTGEAESRDVHHLPAGLADCLSEGADSSSATRGLRSQPESDNQEGFRFFECG